MRVIIIKINIIIIVIKIARDNNNSIKYKDTFIKEIRYYKINLSSNIKLLNLLL